MSALPEAASRARAAIPPEDCRDTYTDAGKKLGLTSIDQPKHCSDLLFARKVTDGYSAGGKGTVHPTILAANT